MEQKIQDLAAKIYKDGVQKGEAEARTIVTDAQGKAASIIADAKKEAEKIVAEAVKQSSDLKRNAESEIRLAGTQALSSIKQQILDLVTAKIIDGGTTTVLSDPGVIKELIFTITKNWKTDKGALLFEAILPEQKRDDVTKAYEKAASELLKSGVSVTFSKNIKAGFRIGPKDGTFKISLTDEDFAEFFKQYLRPKTSTWLFGE